MVKRTEDIYCAHSIGKLIPGPQEHGKVDSKSGGVAEEWQVSGECGGQTAQQSDQNGGMHVGMMLSALRCSCRM